MKPEKQPWQTHNWMCIQRDNCPHLFSIHWCCGSADVHSPGLQQLAWKGGIGLTTEHRALLFHTASLSDFVCLNTLYMDRHTHIGKCMYTFTGFLFQNLSNFMCIDLTTQELFKLNKHSGLSASASHHTSSSDHKKWVEVGNLASMYNHSHIHHN